MPQSENHRWSTPGIANMLAILVFIGSLVFFAFYMQVKGVWTAPPAPGGDAVDYVQIATNIAAGKGFTRDGITPCVDRPPYYPWLLSIKFRRNEDFLVTRFIQAQHLAMVCGALAYLLCRHTRAGSVVCIPLLLVADPRIRTMGAEILTEAYACCLVTFLWIGLSRWFRNPKRDAAIGSGMVLGILILLRTMMVVWLPVIGVLMWMGSPSLDSNSPFSSGEGTGIRARHATLLLITALLIFAPWGYRNVKVLGEFRPLGTQGEEQLAAAWSDEAFARRGMWYNLDEFQFFDKVSSDTSKPLAIRRANLSKDAAKAWVLQHPVKALLLPPMRVFQEFRPHGPGDLFVLSFAVIGLAIVWQTPEGRAARAIILAQTVAIAMTWSVAGRFLYPLLGILHYLAAVGLWGAYVFLIKNRRHARELLFNKPSTKPSDQTNSVSAT